MEARRIARGMRRQIKRRARRKRKLRTLLTQFGMLPADATELQAIAQVDPYLLRTRALTEKLLPHEFGRLLIHLNQRRGFKSNRKSDRGGKDPRHRIPLRRVAAAGGMAEKKLQKLLMQLHLAAMKVDA